jgi:hypothetical protein
VKLITLPSRAYITNMYSFTPILSAVRFFQSTPANFGTPTVKTAYALSSGQILYPESYVYLSPTNDKHSLSFVASRVDMSCRRYIL